MQVYVKSDVLYICFIFLVESLNRLIDIIKEETMCMCSDNSCRQEGNAGAKVAIAIIEKMQVERLDSSEEDRRF